LMSKILNLDFGKRQGGGSGTVSPSA
jgi:hypothetical protein